MLKKFSFGQYSVLLDGKREIIDHLPVSWRKFQAEGNSVSCTIQLRIEENPSQSRFPSRDGWNLQTNDSCQQEVLYSEMGNTLFSIEYKPSLKEITIYAAAVMNKAVFLGLQYGLLVALHKTCVGMHGVTLLCGNEIIILSAPSGTGKTTLARLLETWCDAVTINGDFALLSVSEEGVIFEPTPFCGTSRRCLKQRVRISKIVFLKQATENSLSTLDGRQALINCLDNVFIPDWDKDFSSAVQNNVMRMLTKVRAFRYAFEPTKEAAIKFYNELCI